MTTYLREKALKSDLFTVFVIVYGEDTLLGSVPKSTHREADYRIIIHILDAISKGLNKIIIYCNDTDIVFVSLAFMPVFLEASPQIQVFIQSDTEVFNLKNMCTKLGNINFRMLLFLHAFSGCDYTPSFFGVGKTKFFDEMVKNVAKYRLTITI